MIYDPHNPLDAQNARAKLESLIRRGKVFELKERRLQRTISQNSYLHLLLGYFASQTGDTLEWVKQQYFKRTCNPDLFVTQRDDKLIGRVQYVRSSADLTTEEMTVAIERFRNWASVEAGIYLPEATSKEELSALMVEVERYKTYLY